MNEAFSAPLALIESLKSPFRMRFRVGSIPDEFTPDSSWRFMREPSPLAMQFFAIPLGFAVAAAIGYCWYRTGVFSSLKFEGRYSFGFLISLLLSFPGLIIVHEILHAAVHPGFGRSSATTVGIWPRRLLFYAHYSGPLTRNRFLAVLAMPFFVITVLPLAMAAAGTLAPGFAMAAGWFSIWNAFFACGDYFGFALVLAQVPSGSIVQNRGWRTCWKRA